MIDLTPGQRSATEWLHAANVKAKTTQGAQGERAAEKLATVVAECLSQLPNTQHALFCEKLRTTALALIAELVPGSSAPSPAKE